MSVDNKHERTNKMPIYYLHSQRIRLAYRITHGIPIHKNQRWDAIAGLKELYLVRNYWPLDDAVEAINSLTVLSNEVTRWALTVTSTELEEQTDTALNLI